MKTIDTKNHKTFNKESTETSMKSKFNIAYMTTKYPLVSHTFIRRELLELESRGHKIIRLSIRPPNVNLVDPVDKIELKSTIHCLSQPIFKHFLSVIGVALTRPIRFLDTIILCIKLGLNGERSLLKHIIYIIEACTFLVILNKHKTQHIHAHFGTNVASVARFIKRLGGPSYSFTVHGPTEFDSTIAFDLKGKIEDAAFVIAITKYCSAQLKRWASPEVWDKIHIVGCTVGDEFFNANYPVRSDSGTFVCVGRLTAQKGQLVLIESFSKLIKAGYDAKLVFVGDGELREVIEKKIADEALEDRIIITGYVSEKKVRQFTKESRALVLPSFAEGLPMVIMEAFAIGRPVISTYIAGIPELVRPNENGWLVPAGCSDDLFKAMVEVMQASAEELSEYAVKGRDLTYKYHHTISEVDKLEQLLMRYLK